MNTRNSSYIASQLKHLTINEVLISNWPQGAPEEPITIFFEHFVEVEPPKATLFHNSSGRSHGIIHMTLQDAIDAAHVLAGHGNDPVGEGLLTIEEIYYPQADQVRPGARRVLISGLGCEKGPTWIRQSVVGAINEDRRPHLELTLNNDDRGKSRGQVMVKLESEEQVSRLVRNYPKIMVHDVRIGVVQDAGEPMVRPKAPAGSHIFVW